MSRSIYNDPEFYKVIVAHHEQGITNNAEIAGKLGVSSDTVRRSIKHFTNEVGNVLDSIGQGRGDWTCAWHKSDEYSILIKNPFKPDDQFEAIIQESIAQMEAHSPQYPPLPRQKIEDGHCLLIPFKDFHFGGYGLEKARAVFEYCISVILARSQMFPVDKIIFVGGSDLLHVDNSAGTTTKGTHVKSDGSTALESFRAALGAYTWAIDGLLKIADVEYHHCPGNHDWDSSSFLSEAVKVWYRNSENFTFVEPKNECGRTYSKYGNSLLAFTHGDKVKSNDLPMIVAEEASELWSETIFRYVYQGHLHHRTTIKHQATKEHPGIQLHTLNSPKPQDQWHAQYGFLGGQGVQAFIHHKEHGQVAEFPVNLSHIFKTIG